MLFLGSRTQLQLDLEPHPVRAAEVVFLALLVKTNESAPFARSDVQRAATFGTFGIFDEFEFQPRPNCQRAKFRGEFLERAGLIDVDTDIRSADAMRYP